MVYLMSNAMVDPVINQKGEDLVSQDLLMFDLDTVERMEIAVNGMMYHARIERTSETDASGNPNTKNVYYLEDKEVTAESFLGFYYSLLTLQKERARLKFRRKRSIPPS